MVHPTISSACSDGSDKKNPDADFFFDTLGLGIGVEYIK